MASNKNSPQSIEFHNQQLLIAEKNNEGALIWQRFNIFIAIEIGVHSFFISQPNLFYIEKIGDCIYKFDVAILINIIYCIFWFLIMLPGIKYYKDVSILLNNLTITATSGDELNLFKNGIIKKDKKYFSYKLKTLSMIKGFIALVGFTDAIILLLI